MKKKIGAFVRRPYLHLPPILDHGEWARFTVGEVDEAGLRLCQVTIKLGTALKCD